MKANRKFLHGDEEAVSPVIAVILMVAITVVLAATVYVWVSGFGSNSNSTPAHTMSIVSASAIVGSSPGANAINDVYTKTYTVSSADPSLTYGDLKLILGGTEYTFDSTGCALAPAADDATTPANEAAQWGGCAGTTDRAATASVLAGDTIRIACFQTDTDCLSNKDLLFLDKQANSVMVTLKVR